ncbi:hypothetical protein GGR50DRAFT_676823, partial [Xylaria sp. CBS 124048]
MCVSRVGHFWVFTAGFILRSPRQSSVVIVFTLTHTLHCDVIAAILPTASILPTIRLLTFLPTCLSRSYTDTTLPLLRARASPLRRLLSSQLLCAVGFGVDSEC